MSGRPKPGARPVRKHHIIATGDETDLGDIGVGEGNESGNDIAIYRGATVLPGETVSRYVSDIDVESAEESSLPYKWGCDLRRQDRSDAVILFLGQAWEVDDIGTIYGTNLPGSNDFATIDDITLAMRYFIDGYDNYHVGDQATPDCVSESETSLPHLNLIISTSNYGQGETPNNTNTGHGATWAEMINDLNGWIIETREIDDLIEVNGGIDAELDWNTPSHTLDWASGYNAAAEWIYYDTGDASACPTSGTSATSERCDNAFFGTDDFFQDDVWQLAWGETWAWPFPIDYLDDGEQAAQWQQLSLYGVLNESAQMIFHGSLTQHHTCASDGENTGCEGSLDNTSEDGFTFLWDAINSSTSTAGMISWRTDVTWNWQNPPAIN